MENSVHAWPSTKVLFQKNKACMAMSIRIGWATLLTSVCEFAGEFIFRQDLKVRDRDGDPGSRVCRIPAVIFRSSLSVSAVMLNRGLSSESEMLGTHERDGQNPNKT